MATTSRELLSSSVKSFLRKWVDEDLDYDFKIKYTVDEVREAQAEGDLRTGNETALRGSEEQQ